MTRKLQVKEAYTFLFYGRAVFEKEGEFFMGQLLKQSPFRCRRFVADPLDNRVIDPGNIYQLTDRYTFIPQHLETRPFGKTDGLVHSSVNLVISRHGKLA